MFNMILDMCYIYNNFHLNIKFSFSMQEKLKFNIYITPNLLALNITYFIEFALNLSNIL